VQSLLRVGVGCRFRAVPYKSPQNIWATLRICVWPWACGSHCVFVCDPGPSREAFFFLQNACKLLDNSHVRSVIITPRFVRGTFDCQSKDFCAGNSQSLFRILCGTLTVTRHPTCLWESNSHSDSENSRAFGSNSEFIYGSHNCASEICVQSIDGRS
jgi:hypothetical protein